MAARAFENASVLLLDPVGANLAATRQALIALKFGQVDGVIHVDQLVARAKASEPDLIIAETHGQEDEILKLARGVRTGDIGSNPFVGVILTTWSGDEAHIKSALSSGADDVLLRPFSAATLANRIEAIVTARKGFVVTSDYVGPDRRKAADRPADT
ncbi:MAG: hypothetical protein MI723_09625, partial [Caulobacterales bacterium]|nr:hypothetical protein [Caulobacterales bacterium]